jgi:hypothetical protein
VSGVSDKKNVSECLEKAAKYELLAQFYKYSDPNLHIHYYLKHLNSINMAIHTMHQYPDLLQEDMSEAKIRFLHTSPDAPKIDIYVNNTLLTNGISYKMHTEYMTLPLGKHQIDLYPTGNTDNCLLSKKVTVEHGKSYTIAIIGRMKNLRLIPFLNQPDVPGGEAKIRYLHLSPDCSALDIAVKDRDVIFSDISFKKVTEYLGLTPMTVDLEIREAGTKNIILPMPKSKFLPNEAYTIVIVGSVKGKPGIEVLPIRD